MRDLTRRKSDLGFCLIHTRREYTPLLLECIVIRCGRKNYIRSTQHHTKSFGGIKSIRLWTMRGKHLFDRRDFFFRTEDCVDLFRVSKGCLLFAFDGKQFFELLMNASKENIRYFFENTVVTDEKEVNRFISLILHNYDKLTEKERNRGLSLVRTLKRYKK